MKKTYIKYIAIFLGLTFFVAIRFIILCYIPIEGLGQSSPFISDLLGMGSTVPLWIIVISDIFNLILLWLVGEKILGKSYGLLAALFYAISPWPAYLTVNGSIFIFVLFGVLLFYFGLTQVKEKNFFSGTFLSLLGLVIMIYSNFSMLFVLPFLIWGVYRSDLFTNSNRKIHFAILVFILLPILLFSMLHLSSLKRVVVKNISLFNEIGLINSVNTFRGEVREAGHPYLAVLIENKITYLGRHVVFNTLTAFSPFTYFTQQFKLLGFSFSSPIFLGLLIPFLYALTELSKGGRDNYIF